jgi:hypothetical protein
MAAERAGPPRVHAMVRRRSRPSPGLLAAMTTPPKDTARAVGQVLSPVHRRVVANRRLSERDPGRRCSDLRPAVTASPGRYSMIPTTGNRQHHFCRVGVRGGRFSRRADRRQGVRCIGVLIDDRERRPQPTRGNRRSLSTRHRRA